MTKKTRRSIISITVIFLFSTLLAFNFNSTSAWGQAKKEKEKMFALNFKDVEISEFLTTMSQLIGKNIIIDDKIKGKITIVSAKKIPVSQAYEVMKSILDVKNLAVVETNNLIKILPIREATQKNVQVIVDGKAKDIPSVTDATITYMHELKHASASEILSALKSLKSSSTDIIVYDPLNTLIFSGVASEIHGLVKIATSLDKVIKEEEDSTGITPRGFIHVINLENADAVQLAEVLSRVPFSETAKIETAPMSSAAAPKVNPSRKASRVTQTQAASGAKASKLSIIANKDTNSLIITASPDEFKEIRRVISQLDTVREQVLIEALIVEVSAENSWSFGINWMLGGQSGTNMYGGSSINSAIDASSFGSTINGKTVAMPLASGFQLGYMPDTSVLSFILVNASASDQNYNVLSTPQILTIDNSEAELNVGEEIAYASNSRISDSGTTFYTYEYKSVGIKLKITPHITNKTKITLDLYQEINSIIGTTSESSTSPPNLGKRDLKTKVSVEDGKTIVVGGLIQNKKVTSEAKVPVLGDIPLLGWLFKQKTTEYQKSNLLVFITPHIVTQPDKLDALTRQKQESQRRLDSAR